MFSKVRLVLAVCLLTGYSVAAQQLATTKLWYKQPADASVADGPNGWKNNPAWLHALPVGNGFMGAMVFGDVGRERIQLNDKTLWSGGPADNDNPAAAASVQEIRDLLFANKFKEATALTNKTQICTGLGSGNGNGAKVPFGCFQTLGDLWMDFVDKTDYKNYYRDLNLMDGVASVRYEQRGVQYTREIFASYPDKAIVVHLSASKPKALSFTLSLDRPERFVTSVEQGRLAMAGSLTNGTGGEGMKYKVYVTPVLTGGRLKTEGNKLVISEATTVTLLITSTTNYRQHFPDFVNADFEKQLKATTEAVAAKPYAALRQTHISDFSSLMKRVTLQIGREAKDLLPTDERLKAFPRSQYDPHLYMLYFQYGRYLLISSSRPGSLPANLQGVWANELQTPWNGDYHTDINIQMNYWPAEVTNLSELHAPLVDLITSLKEPGSRTAKTQYNAGGWVMHPITNVWGYTSPGEQASWGMHVGASAWLSQHLWEHYVYTLDKVYLAKVFSLLQSASEFYLDWLVKDPVTGQYLSGPAVSPENTFVAPDGSKSQISMGPAHDHQVIYNLFTNTLNAADELAISNPTLTKIKAIRAQLPPPTVAKDGRLMEWLQEFAETEPTHRHVSHLFALYPGNQISYRKTPALAQAARKSLDGRGDGGTGWSLAWKISFWARLHDGDRALRILNNLLQPIDPQNTSEAGGSYMNLFCVCPPFQIDGNFGGTAAIAELLMQSHEGQIELLPALPARWKEGEITGLCARGGFDVSIKWKDGKLVGGSILSKAGGKCTVTYGNKEMSINTEKGKRYSLNALIGS
ncbi:glycosyl hydrolase family 95 catalytic domain-containing protein [Spirosoma sp. KNUC1025]|uniref:glycoside hydrolase family 95 protein n=1 Tax=Spirosoma sp. KNUC1025 TaxID=2894082 RepID=UPI003868BECB|nr:glycoside hydrolase family 95 protein [Spirosoma sp. KNUC1025]